MIVSALMLATPPRDKFAQDIADELRQDRVLLHSLRIEHETEPRYLLSEDAYTAAINDLEDYQGGDSRVTEEWLTNDALEVWMDLAPYRDSTNIMR